jgi:hypothetical protein
MTDSEQVVDLRRDRRRDDERTEFGGEHGAHRLAHPVCSVGERHQRRRVDDERHAPKPRSSASSTSATEPPSPVRRAPDVADRTARSCSGEVSREHSSNAGGSMTDETRQDDDALDRDQDLREQEERVREEEPAERAPDERHPPDRDTHPAPPAQVEQ